MRDKKADSGLAALAEAANLAVSASDLPTVCDRILCLAADRLGMMRGRVILADAVDGPARPVPYPRASSDIDGADADSAEIASVLTSGQPSLTTGRTVSGSNGEAAAALLCVPIRQGDRILGVVAAESAGDGKGDFEEDQHRLSILAGSLGRAIQVHRMIRQDKRVFADALANRAGAGDGRPPFTNLIGASRTMLDVYATIDRVARTRATILLLGETGTGKELIAKAIHTSSDRNDKPFIRVNCSALSGQLLESELFGHVQGAFTGAVRDKVGRFEAAHGGTLLLDEVSTMELPLQVKLLRVLQEREIERVGDVRTIPMDVRIIAATNERLADAVKAGRFRDDLFYRLNVVMIELPALRERRDDIPRLVDHFLDKYNADNGRELTRISPELMDVLIEYPWPGNVRELENTIEHAVVLSQGTEFTVDLLPAHIRRFAQDRGAFPGRDNTDDLVDALAGRSLDEAAGLSGHVWERVMARIERSLIRAALERCDHVKIKAADLLGINRNTLNKKFRELGLSAATEPDAAPNEPHEENR